METRFNFGDSSKFKFKSILDKSQDGETWKTVSFNDNYKVSNKGRIMTSTGIILKPFIQNSGYFAIGLWRNREKHTITVHKLVAMHFLDYDDNYDIDHIDGNKLNNDITNLRLITHKENCVLREKIKFYHVTKDGEIIKAYTSYETAGSELGYSKHTLRKNIRNFGISPVYNIKEHKYMYFKKV